MKQNLIHIINAIRAIFSPAPEMVWVPVRNRRQLRRRP